MTTRVLVTGGTGYVASWCIALLLRDGHAVRTTVRSTAKGDALRAAITATGAATGALECVVADLLVDDGWDAAVAGCTYVLHVASPLGSHEGDPIAAARDGTLRVLRAANAAGVKRVVMTSAAATARMPRDSTGISDETVWADPEDPRFDAYRRSKIIAERAAWAFVRDSTTAPTTAPTTELTTILPGAVFGPAVVSTGALGSLQIIQRMLVGKMPGAPKLALWIVDVRDLAALHVRAMTAPAAANQRFLATGEMMWMIDIARTLRERLGDDASKAPSRQLPSLFVRAVSLISPELRGLVPELGRRNDVTSAKARELLGFAPRPAADTIADSGRYVLAP